MMSNIDRYRLTAGDGGMYRDEDVEGDWIMYGDYTSSVAKLLSEQDYKYNKQINELLKRHVDKLEVAAEFCRQYQMENKQLKAQSDADNETNLQLNLKNMELQAENKKLGETNEQLGDYYIKINSMYWNDEIFEMRHGEGLYTDEFVKMIDDL